MALADILLKGVQGGSGMFAGVDPAHAAILARFQKYGDPQAAYDRRQARRALGLDLRRNRDVRLAARAGLLPGHAYDRAEAARLRAQGPLSSGPVVAGGSGMLAGVDPQVAVQGPSGPASLADLLAAKPAGAGGAAPGKPMVAAGLAGLLGQSAMHVTPRKPRYPTSLRPFV